MKALLTKDIPRRAAFAVIALVLFASIVTGREAPGPPAVVTPADRPIPRSLQTEPAADLDLEKLKRPRKQETIADLFAPPKVAPPLAAAPVVEKAESAPPPAPVAPPLPFQYLGRIIDGDKIAVFLTRGDEHYSVETGQRIDNLYRVENVTDTAVILTYLPLGTRQVLPVPALN